MRMYGTAIKVNTSKLFGKTEDLIKSVTYTSTSNPDKYMICRTFEDHYEIQIVDEKQEVLGKAFMGFEFTSADDANRKFREIFATDTWMKEEF